MSCLGWLGMSGRGYIWGWLCLGVWVPTYDRQVGGTHPIEMFAC